MNRNRPRNTDPDHRGMIDIRRAWSELVAPVTSQHRRRHLAAALRTEVHRVARSDLLFNAAVSQKRESALELKGLGRDVVVGIVMPRAFTHGRRVYAMLNWMGIADRFVMIGAPQMTTVSGSINRAMAPRIFIPQSDALMLRSDTAASLLLVDDRIDTGFTMAVLGKSLMERLGYIGRMFQSAGSIEPWTGAVAGGSTHARSVQILTEHQMPLISLQR